MTAKVRRARLLSLHPESTTTALARLQWCSVEDYAPIRPGDVAQCLISGQDGIFVAFASLLSHDGQFDWLIRYNTPLYHHIASIGVSDVEVRTPFGHPFPMDQMVGRSIVLVASGTGIAPMRSVIQQIIANRKRYGAVSLVYGARNIQDFAFSAEIASWEASRISTLRTISQPPSAEWFGHVGYVQRHLGRVTSSGPETYVLVCGGYQMTQETMDLAEALGVAPGHVLSNY